MFFNVIGNEDVSSISPSRLLDLMDNLDLSSLGDKNAAYKFAMSAKDLMKKIASGEELNAEEAIKDIRKTFDYENVDEEAEKEKEKVKELDDIDL